MGRTEGPFPYYDEDYPGSGPGPIRASVTGPESNALTLLSIAADLGRDQRQVGSQITGELSGSMMGTLDPTKTATSQLAHDGLVAVGVTRDFANDVATFDRGVNHANGEFQRRYSVANAIRHDPEYRMGDYEGPEPETWAQCYAAGNKYYKDAHAGLDQAVKDYKFRLAHPDKVPLTQYFVDGLLPLEALILFPGVTLTAAEARQAMRHLPDPQLGVPLEVLAARLDLARGLGLAPKEYAGLLRTYWQTKALERAGINIADWDLSKGAQALAPIIAAVYNYYGDIYKQNPRLEWAGLANLVGPSFAAGFLDLGMMRSILAKIDDVLPDQIPLGPFTRADLHTLNAMGTDEVAWWERQFLGMQKQIFLDMGSMNQAYIDGGMPAIREMAAAGLFDMPSNRQATQQMLDSWHIIDDPNSTPAELHAAAKTMAYREQHDIIQDDYDQMYNRPNTGPLVTKMFSTFGEVSVPGGRTMGQVDPSTYSVTTDVDPMPLIPGPHAKLTGSVTMPIPTGNVANFDNRWTYFTADTLPAYVKLLDDPASTGTSMNDIMSRDMNDRIGEYRIYNRVDSIAETFIKNTHTDLDVDIKWR